MKTFWLYSSTTVSVFIVLMILLCFGCSVDSESAIIANGKFYTIKCSGAEIKNVQMIQFYGDGSVKYRLRDGRLGFASGTYVLEQE